MSRWLPLVSRLSALAAALLCWSTVWVPISATQPDSGITIENRLLDAGPAGPMVGTLLAPCLITVLAAIAWLPGVSRWWPFAALGTLVVHVVGVVLYALPGMVCWDGQDEHGNPTGGCEEILPSTGWWLLVAAGVLLLLAALAPLWRRHTVRQEQWGLPDA